MMNRFRLTLLDEKYERIIDRILWLVIIFGITILVSYTAGRNDEAKEQQEVIQQYQEKEKSAVYLTVDSTGAWLGSYPGAKESPLYNHLGEQVGKLKEVTE